MGNAQKIPIDLVLELTQFLEVPELYNLGLASKHFHGFVHPVMLRKALFGQSVGQNLELKRGSTFPFGTFPFHYARHYANPKTNVSILTTLYDFAESEGGNIHIKDKVNETAVALYRRSLIYSRDIETMGALLDHPYLFKVDPYSEEFLRAKRTEITNRELPMIEYIVGRGCKLPSDVLHLVLYMPQSEELCTWLIETYGADINAPNSKPSHKKLLTALSQAFCSTINPEGLDKDFIEMLLHLGANPNENGGPGGTRPIVVLLADFYNGARNWPWKVLAWGLYRYAKLLTDHGASTSPADGWDPVKVLLNQVWRQLLPVAREAAGVGETEDVNASKLLDVLSTVDIEPLDKLCDIVIDASPDYSTNSHGLRGKERLIEMLRRYEEGLRTMLLTYRGDYDPYYDPYYDNVEISLGRWNDYIRESV